METYVNSHCCWRGGNTLNWVCQLFILCWLLPTSYSQNSTTVATEANSFDDIPKIAVSVAAVAAAVLLGLAVAKLADYCYDRESLRDDASDISEHTRELLKARLTVLTFKNAAMRNKEAKKEQSPEEAAKKVARLWSRKASLKALKRNSMDAEAGIPGLKKTPSGITILSVKEVDENKVDTKDESPGKPKAGAKVAPSTLKTDKTSDKNYTTQKTDKTSDKNNTSNKSKSANDKAESPKKEESDTSNNKEGKNQPLPDNKRKESAQNTESKHEAGQNQEDPPAIVDTRPGNGGSRGAASTGNKSRPGTANVSQGGRVSSSLNRNNSMSRPGTAKRPDTAKSSSVSTQSRPSTASKSNPSSPRKTNSSPDSSETGKTVSTNGKTPTTNEKNPTPSGKSPSPTGKNPTLSGKSPSPTGKNSVANGKKVTRNNSTTSGKSVSNGKSPAAVKRPGTAKRQ